MLKRVPFMSHPAGGSCILGCTFINLHVKAPSNKVLIAQLIVIPARFEAHFDVTTAVAGLCVLTHSSRSQVISLASGVADALSNVPFRVRILNPSDWSITLSKGMVIGSASTRPQRIITVSPAVETLLTQVDEDNDTSPPMGKAEPPPAMWQGDVKLDPLGLEELQTVLRMIEPNQKMWDGHLGTFAATSHRIEFTAGSKPDHCQHIEPGSAPVALKMRK
jgi:hypothetical protein